MTWPGYAAGDEASASTPFLTLQSTFRNGADELPAFRALGVHGSWQRMSSTLRESRLTSKPQRTPWVWKPEGPLETSSQMGPEDPAVSPGPEAPSSQLQGFWPGEGKASQTREECPEKHPKGGRKDKLALCSPFPPHDTVSKNRPSSPTQKTMLSAMPAIPLQGMPCFLVPRKLNGIY